MGIQKVISKIATLPALSKAANVSQQSTSLINNVEKVLLTGNHTVEKAAVQVKKLSDKALFHTYPESLQKSIMELKHKLAGSQNRTYESFLDNLVTYNTETKMIEKIVNSPDLLKKYVNSKRFINKKLSNVSSESEILELVSENISLMSIFNGKSFKNLINSKGFKEISNENLSIEYIKSIKPSQKIDEDFFYKLFERIGMFVDKEVSSVKGLDKKIF